MHIIKRLYALIDLKLTSLNNIFYMIHKFQNGIKF